MVKPLHLLLITSILLNVQACSLLPRISKTKTVEKVVPMEQAQEVSVNIIEGRTTKQEIIDALGSPAKLSSNSLEYLFNAKKICKLSLTQKRGTTFNTILGPTGNNNTIIIEFNDKDIAVNVIVI